MKKYLFILFTILFVACSNQPQPINYGTDECAECKMTIMDKKFGAELISAKGKVFKFDDWVCMIGFIKNGGIAENEINKRLVLNYQTENSFIDAEKAVYYVTEDLHSPMNGNAAAFQTMKAAQKFQDNKPGVIMEWSKLYETLR
jgi:copper chaperone NosL